MSYIKWKLLSHVLLFGLYTSWNSPGQHTGGGSLSFLQGIFPTQGSNLLCLLYWQVCSLLLVTPGKPQVSHYIEFKKRIKIKKLCKQLRKTIWYVYICTYFSFWAYWFILLLNQKRIWSKEENKIHFFSCPTFSYFRLMADPAHPISVFYPFKRASSINSLEAQCV